MSAAKKRFIVFMHIKRRIHGFQKLEQDMMLTLIIRKSDYRNSDKDFSTKIRQNLKIYSITHAGEKQEKL